MKIKFLLISISAVSLCLSFDVKGQDYIDFAQIFSQREISGSARMQGLGGASTSLGGDLTSTIGNPAGLGFFNRSEFSFSPSLGFHNSEFQSGELSSSDYRTNFNFGNIGVVLNNTKRNSSGEWKGGSFGISMTRINDFYFKGSVPDFNTDSSFINYSVDYLNHGQPLGIPDLAYETYLVNEFFDESNLYDENGDTIFFYDQDVIPVDDPANLNKPVSNRQSEQFTTSGATYETTFAYGGNYADKLYVGASVGFVNIDYEIERRYSESPLDPASYLNYFTLYDKRSIEGSGINLSLGLIYKPVNELAIGLSYSSPTFYSIEERSNPIVSAYYKDSSTPYESSLPIAYDFDLRTPSIYNAGATYFFGKSGFITADVEYINYSNNDYSANSEYGPNDNSLERANNFINASFNNRALNYKIGGEYRFNIFRVRAGYAFFADPTDNSFNDGADRSRQSLSLGGGIRLPKYYVDLAVVNTRYESNYLPLYEGGFSSMFDNNSTRAMLTVGFNF